MNAPSYSKLPYQWIEKRLPLFSLLFIVVVCSTVLVPFLSLEDFWFQDLMFKSRAYWDVEDDLSDNIVHVDIDDLSYRELKTVMMDRKFHQAPVLEALKELGVRHSILDIEFFDPVQPRLKIGASQKLSSSIEPLLEKLLHIKTEDEFEKQGEFGMAFQPFLQDIKNLEEDPNLSFATALNNLTATIGMHHSEVSDSTLQNLAISGALSTAKELAVANALNIKATSNDQKVLVLVPPHNSLYKYTDATRVGWGIVNVPSSEDGTVRTAKLYHDVGEKRYLHLALRAYLMMINKTPSDIVFTENEIQIGDIRIPVQKNGLYLVNWNSQLIKDDTIKIPFVRLHDLKTAEHAGRTAFKKALVLDEEHYVKHTRKGDYVLQRNKKFDLIDDSPEKLLAVLNQLKPLSPLKTFSPKTESYLLKAKKNLNDWKTRYEKLKWLKGKTVFIGAAGTSSIDRRPSPISPNISMVTLHSSIYNSFLQKKHLRKIPVTIEALATFLLMGLVAYITFKTAPLKSAAVMLVLSGTVLGLGFFLFTRGWLLNSGGTIMESLGWLNAGITSINEFVELKQKKYFKTLQPHLSPDAVKYVEDHPETPLIGKRRMTVLFSDIEGFTAFCKDMGPDEIKLNVNRIMDALTPVIFEYNGTFDKFMGDSLMAFFGAPMPFEDYSYKACACALKLNSTLTTLAKEFVSEGLKPLKMNMGIATGEMSYGNFGSSGQFDLTVLGSTVNTASRIQNMTRALKASILICEETHKDVEDLFNINDLGPQKTKENSEPLNLYHLDSIKVKKKP